MKSRADRRFARFVRTRDPRDLAFVFDATAGELWRVAAFLCRRQQDAEDAVQATFVVAIENAQSWDASRPVLPWLLGMLVNRVRAQRRVDRRVVAVDVAERRVEGDPAQAAAERELHDRVAELVAEVRGPFRAVLECALLHGEAPQQIAEWLGLPAATVRSRLHRGLVALRRRLPTGALAVGPAVPMVPAVLSPQVAARVRAKVLERVGDGASVATGAVAVGAGVGLTSAAMVTGAAVAVVAVAATWWFGSGAWQAAVAVTPVVENGRVAVVAAEAGESSGERVGQVAQEPERTLAPAPVAAVGTLRVVVRHGGTGEVVPGIRVMATHDEPEPSAATPSSNVATSSAAVAGEHVAPERAAGDTDADGRVTLRLVAGPARIVCSVGSRTPTSVIVPSGGELEVVLELPVMMVADVLVLDAGGRPVPGASILQPGGSMGDQLIPPVIGRTDEHGHWRSSRIEPELRLLAVASGHVPSAADLVVPQRPTCELRLGGAAVTVTGRVRDADGRTVPGAWVAFDDDVDANATVAVRTDDDGRFVSNHVASGRQFVVAARDAAGKQGAAAVQMLDVQPGTTPELELRLPRGASLVVHIQVPGVIGGTRWASVRPQDLALSQVMRQWLTRGADVEPDGSMRLSGLTPGRYQLSIGAGSQRATREVELRDGEAARIDHVFANEARLRLELVDEHGAPRPGLKVSLLAEGRTAQVLVSDERGVVEFCRVPIVEHEIVVGGSSNDLGWLHQTVLPGKPVRIVVPAALGRSRVRGRLVVRGAPPSGMRYFLQRAEPGVGSDLRQACQGEIDAADASFSIDGLPPGRFRLTIAAEMAILAMRGPLEVPADGVLDLGDIEVGLGSVQVVGRGVESIVAPHLCLMMGVAVAMRRPLEADGGAMRATGVPNGFWSLLVWGENIEPAQASVEVRQDAQTTVAIDPVPGTPTTLLLPEVGWLTFTFADGRSAVLLGMKRVVQGMPRGSHRVELVTFNGERHSAEFTVGDTPGDPVELR